jgi:UDP-N-acetylmuramate dehydrogenase
MRELDRKHREWISARFGRGVRFGAPLSRYTTLGIGGPAAALVHPLGTEDLAALVIFARDNALPLLVLGKGSNLLVRDSGFPGIVVSLARGFSQCAVLGEQNGRILVEAGAGVSLMRLCRLAAKEGLGGLAFAAGIPGSAGGALMMNAGALGGSMSDVVESMALLGPDGRKEEIPASEARWSYRRMETPARFAGSEGRYTVILSARFSLTPGNAGEIARETERLLALRRLRQPRGGKSAGCFFKNLPDGTSAGALIDKAGFRGRRLGGAMVSQKHANFLVNAGGATARDVLALAEEIRAAVRGRFGVELEAEVKTVGAP